MALFFSLFLALYGVMNYYIFIRGWQALAAYPSIKPFYMAFFILAAVSYILAKIIWNYLPPIVYDGLLWLGSFWFAFMIYFFLFIVLIDFTRLLNNFFSFFPDFIKNNYELTKQVTLISVLVIVSGVIIYGFINSRHIVIKTIEITLPKGNGTLTELNAVVASDLHLSPLNDDKLLTNIISKINSLNPDLVLLPGDIVDDKAEILKHRGVGTAFRNINSKYGIYACTGNHEFITGVNEAVRFMQDYGINVLRDSTALVANSFVIAGRDDRTNRKRKSLQEILTIQDKNYPVILLDHTPFALDEAQQNGVSIQLSGHTHHGQLFPGNLITSKIYELSWGYLKKGNTHYYVTCGVGTWGPPVRIGSDTEIINLKIKFE